MGLLTKHEETNVLTKNDFTYKNSSATGQLQNCYEKCIPVGSSYFAWIAVSTKTGDVVIYVEYDCGGEIATCTHSLNTSYDDDPDDFFEELDTYVTETLEYYAN